MLSTTTFSNVSSRRSCENELGELVRLAGHRVLAVVADQLLELAALALAEIVVHVIAVARMPASVTALDRNHGLAGDVTPEDDVLDVVEAARVQELLEATLRAVNIRDEAQPQRGGAGRGLAGEQPSHQSGGIVL